ncbi:metallophosphoesterase [Selenomonadales bacterium OttesenSCG-928-I06]|nr:metallophosphoesterase [Selenomonadales bacterium OttesenSCG-928-I06]
MRIFAIADLHLSGDPPYKPMTVFGHHWDNHWNKIKNDWYARVTDEDVVLIAGDISWAMKLNEALVDLNDISLLPGKKVFVKGNHDYWWQSINKMNTAMENRVKFLQNNFFAIDDFAICGSRGWTCPGESSFTSSDLPIYERELLRVESSIQEAKQNNFDKIVLALHFPPFPSTSMESGFVDLIKKYDIKICVYGHLHSEAAYLAKAGFYDDIYYYLVSCDVLNFSLQEIDLGVYT